MIKNPYLIVGVLFTIEVLVLWLNSRKRFERMFRVIPYVFWIYFLPMLMATAGLIEPKSPVFGLITTHLLPACLFLLLLPVDLKAILRLGGPALIMMGAGSAGIMLGTVIAFQLFKGIVGTEFWSGFGALSASWTGGSANMIAVKEAIGTPDRVFLPMVVVDTIVPYAWMGLLMSLVARQDAFDRWVGAKKHIIDDLKSRTVPRAARPANPLRFFPTILLIALALGMSLAAQWSAGFLPEIAGMLSKYTWTIIIITSLGMAASFTPARALDDIGATKVGYFILYFVLTSIGAKASLSQAGTIVPLILAGCVIVVIHAGIMVLTARLIRAPMLLAAVASQANIGGVASAPIVAELYQPGFAPVGLLLAVFGNIVGTYLGILTAQGCRLLF